MKEWMYGSVINACVVSVLLWGNGCAQDVSTPKGAEALLYTVSHSYQFTLTPNSKPAEDEIERIVREARQLDFDASITIRYRSLQGQAFVKRQLATWKWWGLSPQQYRMEYQSSLPSDVMLDIELTRFMTETCYPREIEQPAHRIGCFVDTLRMKQVARPAHYPGNNKWGEH